jgi:poly(hydroxyalkanoate) granule-associated protein
MTEETKDPVVEEANKVVEEAQAAAAEAQSDAAEAVTAAAESVSETVSEAAAAVPAAEAPTGNGKDAKNIMHKSTAKVAGKMKEVAAEVEKNPQAGKVIKAVKDVREDIESGEYSKRVQKVVKDTAAQVEANPLVGLIHRVLLAGVGAVALAQDEMEEFINRLVERGEIAEADGKRILRDVMEQRRKDIEKAQKTASEYAENPRKAVDDAEKRIEAVMVKMNIPTKEEIEALSAKITALTKKVDELKKDA